MTTKSYNDLITEEWWTEEFGKERVWVGDNLCITLRKMTELTDGTKSLVVWLEDCNHQGVQWLPHISTRRDLESLICLLQGANQ